MPGRRDSAAGRRPCCRPCAAARWRAPRSGHAVRSPRPVPAVAPAAGVLGVCSRVLIAAGHLVPAHYARAGVGPQSVADPGTSRRPPTTGHHVHIPPRFGGVGCCCRRSCAQPKVVHRFRARPAHVPARDVPSSFAGRSRCARIVESGHFCCPGARRRPVKARDARNGRKRERVAGCRWRARFGRDPGALPGSLQWTRCMGTTWQGVRSRRNRGRNPSLAQSRARSSHREKPGTVAGRLGRRIVRDDGCSLSICPTTTAPLTLIRRAAVRVGGASATSSWLSPTPSTYATASGASGSTWDRGRGTPSAARGALRNRPGTCRRVVPARVIRHSGRVGVNNASRGPRGFGSARSISAGYRCRGSCARVGAGR